MNYEMTAFLAFLIGCVLYSLVLLSIRRALLPRRQKLVARINVLLNSHEVPEVTKTNLRSLMDMLCEGRWAWSLVFAIPIAALSPSKRPVKKVKNAAVHREICNVQSEGIFCLVKENPLACAIFYVEFFALILYRVARHRGISNVFSQPAGRPQSSWTSRVLGVRFPEIPLSSITSH